VYGWARGDGNAHRYGCVDDGVDDGLCHIFRRVHVRGQTTEDVVCWCPPDSNRCDTPLINGMGRKVPAHPSLGNRSHIVG